MPYRIALLLYPGCMPAGLFAFADLAHAANRLAGSSAFETVFVAAAAGGVTCAHGQCIEPAALLDAQPFDAAVVPGFWGDSPEHVQHGLAENAGTVAALARLPRRTTLMSYCTGVALLAAAGRLRGRAATATWWLADALRKAHPQTDWQTERAVVADAVAATASGAGGYLALAQALIEQRLGEKTYRDLARLMVLPRPERTHPAFRTVGPMERPDPLLRRLHALAEREAASALTVARMAAQLHTTERTLARKVAQAAGMPAAAYLRRVKLNQVGERLAATTVPAATISLELGFSSDASMRRMFKDLTGMTPAQYRQAYGRI